MVPSRARGPARGHPPARAGCKPGALAPQPPMLPGHCCLQTRGLTYKVKATTWVHSPSRGSPHWNCRKENPSGLFLLLCKYPAWQPGEPHSPAQLSPSPQAT